MDCGAGSALGRQFVKDALHMHGGVGMGTSGNPEQDALMNEMMMMQQQQQQSGHTGEWAQQFAAHHHHHHHMNMQRQQNDVVMLQQQQREMEEAFRASSAVPQQAVPTPAMMGPHMMGPMMGGPGFAGFMMGGPSMMMMPQHPQMMVPSRPVMATATNKATTQEATSTATAVESNQTQEDNAWTEKLREAEWGQDYSDVQEYTLDGQTPQTMEEHAANSKFYQFMDKIRNKELIIDEEIGQVVEGPGPDPDVAEDTEYLKEWANAEGLEMPPGVFEHMQQQGGLHQGAGYMHAGNDGGMPLEKEFDPTEDLEDWAKEYAELQEQMQKAQNNTDYPFEPNNPYMHHDNPLEEGREMLQLGNLAEAALAFEAVCQKQPEYEEGWRLLGTTQAENEKDMLAIIALNHARMLDPKDSAVHAALAVSHTNEHNSQAALQSLRAWLLSNPQYEHLGSVNLQDVAGPGEELDVTSEDFYFAAPSEYRECRTLLQAAVEMNPTDPQLHASLGVLHSLSNRFDDAAADFRHAVELRPDDAKLWNKLGATLANGNKPEEALEAYNRALDINPGYVRAMYNMAVSYSNMAQYPLAAKQITRAIAVQSGGTQPQGEGSRQSTRGLWDLLRMALNLMDRSDLVELTWEQDVTPFLKEFGLEDMLI
ncbi:putative peroxisome targeting signal 1 receptor [Trypanosoma theileri]|uniref:Putative peroxisome targeting signal 1 receptor n=1 Tax=Trypanosoma theileri TaxID=67003 RepID=A0A1X0NH73_9TRYP|nr:putative peroxisome targeting signal 1 receptor [Trypanosoma theileri]ORC84122.1 putative peroxisome targeting signal 1 receptor [Trypanosoma theileri]